ncbi:MAG TPA: hypothetical protein VMH80_03925 [Bryobacteraceae bacterium]|nr:hypothetical protein [Bryobacteraceae bacterium]
MYIDVFHTQKAGNAASEYEDAFWSPEPTTRLPGDALRVAIADGATDAVFSGLWARLLVKAYGKRRMTGETADAHLAKAAQVWGRAVAGHPLPWYAEEKARKGAYAALVGLELHRGDDGASGTWSALACGDSCFFHLRSDTVIKSFPITRSEEFSNAPLLLGSHVRTRGLEGVRTETGDWQEGDCFYLMSDALASWFLTRCEAGDVPWQALRDVTLAKDPPFEEWIASLRTKRTIKNDDCTLIGVTCEHC